MPKGKAPKGPAFTSSQAEKLAQVDRCLAGLLTIMDRSPHAESYWPIFDWLERERETLISRENRVQAARERINRICQDRTAG